MCSVVVDVEMYLTELEYVAYKIDDCNGIIIRKAVIISKTEVSFKRAVDPHGYTKSIVLYCMKRVALRVTSNN